MDTAYRKIPNYKKQILPPQRDPAKAVARYKIPDTKYSLDNAAMIAVAGYYQFKLAKNKKKFDNNWKNMEADANLELM